MSTTHFFAGVRSVLLPGKITNGLSAQDVQSVYVMYVYSFLAFLVLSVFGVLHVVADRGLVGRIELAGSAAVLLNAVGLRLTGSVVLTRAYYMITILVLLFGMLLTGGTEGTGIFWFFVYPAMAFFLAGKKQGLYWMAALYVMVFGVVLAARAGLVFVPYATVTVRQMLISLAALSAGVYVYQGARESAQLETIIVNRAKDDFITLASHQLRTPISAISWLSEILLSGDTGTLNAEQRKNVQQIYQSNQRMSALISDMLIVTSIDLANLPVRLEKLKLSSVTRSVLKGMKYSLLSDRKLTIKEVYDSKVPEIEADMEISLNIFHNLISNAIKYTPDGGEVTVSIAASGDKLHPGSAGSVQVTIADTGYGIPAAAQARLFTKFFRAKNIQAKDTDGTGLGLFMVKSLLDYVGGTVSFVSTEKKGSAFTVRLPLEGMRPVRVKGAAGHA